MRKFDFVIFDCDGVLVDSEPTTNQVIRNNLAGYGLDLTLHEIMDSFVGGTMFGIYDEARAMGATLPETWVDEIYQQMFEGLRESVQPIPGAIAVLDVLDAAGVGYAIGSNGPHEKMRITLGRTGLAERLKGRVYSREDVPNPKPAPDVYLKAAEDAGMAPEQCVVIEDSASGARAGKAAGMVTFGFIAETPADTLAPICDALFADMAELPEMLGL